VCGAPDRADAAVECASCGTSSLESIERGSATHAGEILDAIHTRLLRGDVTASSELFRVVHTALAATLRKRVGTLLSWDAAGDMATDAIVAYTNTREKLDPSRAGLFG